MADASKPTKAPAPCIKCGGSGTFRWGAFTNGVSQFAGGCFRCSGTGRDPQARVIKFPADWTEEQRSAFTAKDEARKERARDRARERKREKEAAVWLVNLERFPILEKAQHHTTTNSFIDDVVSKARRFELSERQAEALATAVERSCQQQVEDKTEAERAVSVPEGRQTITGKVLSMKWTDGAYGSTYKMLVKVTTEDGEFKVWGTVPSALQGVFGCIGCNTLESYDHNGFIHADGCNNHIDGYFGAAEVGATVRFVATVERSRDDASFGFFKRPTKAEVLVEAIAD